MPSLALRGRVATFLASLTSCLRLAQAFVAANGGVSTDHATSTARPTAAIADREAPPTTAAVLGYSALGCYSDAGYFQGSRVLSSLAYSGSVVEPTGCAVWCSAAGFTVFGVEYSSHCFCDSGLARGAPSATDAKSCSAACHGDASAVCGGNDYINVYSLTNSLAGPVTVTMVLNPTAQSSISATTATVTTTSKGSVATAASSSGQISAGAIAGVAVGCLLGGVLLCILMFALFRWVRPPRRRDVGLKLRRRLSVEGGPVARGHDTSSKPVHEMSVVPYL